MASISISEKDFEALANAANLAYEQGKLELAEKLDIIARKANASLTNAPITESRKNGFGRIDRLNWKEVPSTIRKV